MRIAYFDSYVSIDPGFKDRTGILYGYWDFTAAKLIIQDESAELPPGAVRVAGELPPAEPGRTLDELSVEDLANIR